MNGQIAVLTTKRYGRPCASELLLFNKETITVLSTIPNYRWWWNKKPNDLSGYSSVLYRNKTGRNKELRLPSNFFLIEKNRHGTPVKQGRSLAQGTLSPLTKGMFYEQLDLMELSQLGSEEPSLSATIAKSWEFYALFILLVALVPISDRIGLLPPLFAQHWGLMILPFCALDGALLFLILRTKEALYKENPDHPWFKLDAFFTRFFFRIVYIIIVFASIGVAFMPNVADKDTKEVTTLLSLAHQLPVIYLALVLIAGGVLTVLYQRRSVRVAALTFYLIGNSLLWYINEAFTDNTVTTPEPYTSITLGILIFGFLYSTIQLILCFRKNSKDHLTSINPEKS
jgi:hypothetical protein